MHQDETSPISPVEINFANISNNFQRGFWSKPKCVLQGVSGSFKCGELTAIMGPSGAGKSTLLNILSGFQKNFEGSLTYRTENSHLSWKSFKKFSRYIQQDDALFTFFTVQETISMAAELKLDAGMSRDYKAKIIDDVLSSLDLIRTKDTLCGHLSGGERKRFSIALEMLNDPQVMFLDEPTTGLDSSAATQCTSVLKNLARSSRTIVCTIHQPSTTIYEMFDHVYLIAEGRCVYQGDPMNIVAYLSGFGLTCPKYHNPADYAMEVMSNEYGNFNQKLSAEQNDTWRRQCLKTDLEKSKRQTMRVGNPPSELRNARVLLNRCLLRFYKDWQTTSIRFIIYLGLALLIGATYYDCGFDANKFPSNLGMLTLLGIIIFYCSLLPAVLKFPFELTILRKEHLNDWYKIRTHYVVFVVTNLIFQFVFVFLLTGIVYVLSNQPLVLYRFFMYEVMLVLFAFVGEASGLIFGILFKPVAGIFACIVFGVSQVSFCGFFIYYNHMNPLMYQICQLMFTKYVTEGVIYGLYGFNREKLDCPSEIIYCHFRDPIVFLKEIGFGELNFRMDVIVVVSHAVVFFIIAYFLLKRKVSSV